MERFKEEHFIKQYNENIKLERPTSNELNQLSKHLQDLGIAAPNIFLTLVERLKNNELIADLDKAAGIQKALQYLYLNEKLTVLVIWNYPSDIDKFKLPYLLKYWKDLWYPIGDDAVCLYFPLTDKILVVTHYQKIYF